MTKYRYILGPFLLICVAIAIHSINILRIDNAQRDLLSLLVRDSNNTDGVVSLISDLQDNVKGLMLREIERGDRFESQWERDERDAMSLFFSILIAPKVEVDGREVGPLSFDQRLQLCRFVLDWTAKERAKGTPDDPNTKWIDESKPSQTYSDFTIAFDANTAEQSGLDFLKDPNDLMSLEDYEKSRPKYELVHEVPNGIACPKCGKELYDDLTVVITTYPAMTPIFCKNCDYTGAKTQ